MLIIAPRGAHALHASPAQLLAEAAVAAQLPGAVLPSALHSAAVTLGSPDHITSIAGQLRGLAAHDLPADGRADVQRATNALLQAGLRLHEQAPAQLPDVVHALVCFCLLDVWQDASLARQLADAIGSRWQSLSLDGKAALACMLSSCPGELCRR